MDPSLVYSPLPGAMPGGKKRRGEPPHWTALIQLKSFMAF